MSYKKRQALKRSCALDSELDSSASDEEPPVTARSSKQPAKSKEKKGKSTKKVDTEAEISSDEEVPSKSKQIAAKSKTKEKKVVKNSEASSDEESKSKQLAAKSKSKEKKVVKNSEASSDEESSEVKRKRKVPAKKQTKKKPRFRCVKCQRCQMFRNGLRLRKIHRILKFKQSPYLKQYIDLNTHLRQQSVSVFEQDFFKLLNNSIFGKTLEDTERRVNVKLVNSWNDERNKTKKYYSAELLISRPNFHSATIFSENLVAIQLNREKVVLDKPIYIGFSVLELSKSHMYNFHYSVMKHFYKDKLSLCYTDTDSYLYSIQTEDFYEDLKSYFSEYFDTSNYPVDNKFKILQKNKKVPGLFKDELGGRILLEFVGLRSKLYSIKTSDSEIKKAKGVNKCVASTIRFSDYVDVLSSGNQIRKKNIHFKSIKHKLFTQEQDKVALSHKDDKRFILKGNIVTKSWGHYSITI